MFEFVSSFIFYLSIYCKIFCSVCGVLKELWIDCSNREGYGYADLWKIIYNTLKQVLQMSENPNSGIVDVHN